MITKEQMQRCILDLTTASQMALQTAKSAERSLENYRYRSPHDPDKLEIYVKAYQDADYSAEGNAWLLQLAKADFKRIYGE